MLRRKVVVSGAGLISSMTDSCREFHSALCDGCSGLGPITGFNTNGQKGQLGGEIKDFSAKRYLPDKNLRPLDRLSQFVTAAAHLALEESGCTVEMRNVEEVGLVCGSMFAGVQTVSEFHRRSLTLGPSYASPMDFANCTINAPGGQAAIWHNLRGPNSAVSAGIASGLWAVSYATDLVRNGHVSVILAGGAEEMCFESFCAFEVAGLICGSKQSGEFPFPFDARRNGFALAEGAAFLVLELAESAARRGVSVACEIKGHGIAYDCSSGKDSRKSISAITRAIWLALSDAQMTTSDIDCMFVSANGSVEIDYNEAWAIASAFKEQARILPLSAIKSATGEALGASGPFQAIAAMETLRTQMIPGSPLLEQIGKDLPSIMVCRETRKIDATNVMINSIGFDGHCSSLILSRFHP